MSDITKRFRFEKSLVLEGCVCHGLAQEHVVGLSRSVRRKFNGLRFDFRAKEPVNENMARSTLLVNLKLHFVLLNTIEDKECPVCPRFLL